MFSHKRQLLVSRFGSPNASLHLEKVVEQVLLDPAIPFKLSAKVSKNRVAKVVMVVI